MAKYALAFGVLAAVQHATPTWAQSFDANDVLWRLKPYIDTDDQCHTPHKNYVLSKAGGEVIPPCIAEQGVSYQCELLSGILNIADAKGQQKDEISKAYHDCMVGPKSTFAQDVEGCLQCKLRHKHINRELHDVMLSRGREALDEFKSEPFPRTTLWNGYTSRRWSTINWGIGAPVDKSKKVDQIPVSEYYTPTQVQGLGTFVLKNQTYPEAALRSQGLLPEVTMERADPAPEIIQAQVAPVSPAQESSSLSSTEQPSSSHASTEQPSSTPASTEQPSPSSASPKESMTGQAVPSQIKPTTAVKPLSNTPNFKNSTTTPTAPVPIVQSSASAVAESSQVAAPPAANDTVLVQPVAHVKTLQVTLRDGLEFSVATVDGGVHVIDGTSPVAMAKSETDQKHIPDLSQCSECKKPVDLASPQKAAPASVFTSESAIAAGKAAAAASHAVAEKLTVSYEAALNMSSKFEFEIRGGLFVVHNMPVAAANYSWRLVYDLDISVENKFRFEICSPQDQGRVVTKVQGQHVYGLALDVRVNANTTVLVVANAGLQEVKVKNQEIVEVKAIEGEAAQKKDLVLNCEHVNAKCVTSTCVGAQCNVKVTIKLGVTAVVQKFDECKTSSDCGTVQPCVATECGPKSQPAVGRAPAAVDNKTVAEKTVADKEKATEDEQDYCV